MAASTPLRILHLVGADEDLGGVLSVVRNIQAGTGPACHHIAWVNQSYRETRQPPLDYRRSRHLLMETPTAGEFIRRGWLAFAELRDLLAQEPFDVLHAHARGPLVVAMLATVRLRRPVLFTNHAFARRTRFYRLAAYWPRLTTVVLSPAMARHYRLPKHSRQVKIISACCADSFLTEPLRQESALRSANAVLHLAGVGNVIRWKNWNLVVQALSLLSEDLRRRVQFDIWGPTPSDADSLAYAREIAASIAAHQLDSQVRLRGSTNGVTAALQGADWFILPSTNEPCSVALMEALALGVPAIASASGGNGDILHNGRTGLLFRPDDASDLARQLSHILRGEFRAAEPTVLRDSVRLRSASAIGMQYLELYRTMAAAL